MDPSNAEYELKAALTALETSLNTPIVSGELGDWLEAVRKSWAEASAQIRHHVNQLHPRQFEQIGKEDPELLPRVEPLQREDRAIEEECVRITLAVERNSQHVPRLEPDEEKALKHTKKLVEDGIAAIVRVRKQEVAIQTWYLEAFNRDRGAVD
jgi:hypothetical protein